MTLHYSKGFTLIELLVVISIFAYLSTVVLASLNGARVKSRDTIRVEHIRSIQAALESFHSDRGQYPQTFNNPNYPTIVDPLLETYNPTDGTLWLPALQVYSPYPPKFAECGSPAYVPGLQPYYIAVLPTDPALDCSGVPHSWVYASDGIDYKLITHPEQGTANSFVDPAFDGGSNPCIVDNTSVVHYGIWTEGATCWSI